MAGVGTENIPIRATDAAATLDGKNVRVGQVISTAGGKAVVSLDGGGTAELSSLTFADPEIAKVYEAAATHGVNAARALVEGYDGSLSAERYAAAANQYIKVGEAGPNKETVTEVSTGEHGLSIKSEVTRASLLMAGEKDAGRTPVQLAAVDGTESAAASAPELSV